MNTQSLTRNLRKEIFRAGNAETLQNSQKGWTIAYDEILAISTCFVEVIYSKALNIENSLH